jgi:hypothetical protein
MSVLSQVYFLCHKGNCLSVKSKEKNITASLTLSLLMSHICGVSKTFGEWYQKTNKTEDTNKLTLLAFKIIIILHNTRMATFIKLLETVSKGLLGIDSRTAVTRCWIAAGGCEG